MTSNLHNRHVDDNLLTLYMNTAVKLEFRVVFGEEESVTLRICSSGSYLKCSSQDSALSEMHSEEFAITFFITSKSTLVFTGSAAKSCQLIGPHASYLSSIYFQILAEFHSYKGNYKILKYLTKSRRLKDTLNVFGKSQSYVIDDLKTNTVHFIF